MTVSTSVRKAGPYPGNGVAAVFAFSFKVFKDTDMLVVKSTTTTGAEQVLALGTDFTVALNSNQDVSPGGTVQLTAGALSADYSLTLASQVPETQSSVFTNTGGFYPSVLNACLDRLTVLVQQVSERVSRAILVPISGTGTPNDLLTEIVEAVDDAVNAATGASGSASAAAGSATTASNAATAASGSATAAAGSASAAAGSATTASNAATAASGSATAAAGSATTAGSAATAAAGSATAASGSATAAAGSATTASNAATAAAGSATAASGSASAALASELAAAASAAAAAGLGGAGQTYQDMTASRSSGTVFNNGTGKPILVVVAGSSLGGPSIGETYVDFGPGGGAPLITRIHIAAFANAGGYMTPATFIVPAGWDYRVVLSNVVLNYWTELR